MGFFRKLKQDGVSLRVMHFIMIVLAAVVSCVLVFATFHAFGTYQTLSDATDEYINLEKDAYALLAASDYLTENAQRFTLAGELEYVDAYLEEAYHAHRREEALDDMSQTVNGRESMSKLSDALEASNVLMERELYAMKLVVAAKGYEEYPDTLKDVELALSDSVLSKANQLTLAQNLVLGKAYYRQKEIIRGDIQECLLVLENTAHAVQANSARDLGHAMTRMRVIILMEAACVLLMILLTTWLGIRPVLKAVDRINSDSPLAVIGANEFRYLARTYNRMYEVYKKSVASLNYKASHDELTGLYNRAGYDLLLTGVDLANTVMLVFDVDNFKDVNDLHGHETGDRALQKVANTVRKYFRSEDYICRIGGDEFVVLMVHAESLREEMIGGKVSRINAELAKNDDGLPPLSISAGAAHGASAGDVHHLFELADQALYETKRNGRRGCTFHAA